MSTIYRLPPRTQVDRVARIVPSQTIRLNKVPVTAQYLDYDGTPKIGTVTFTPSVVLIDSANKQMFMPKAYVAILDIDGKISIDLPASDDPDLIPFDIMRYALQENIIDGRFIASVKIPYLALFTGYDLTSIEL